MAKMKKLKSMDPKKVIAKFQEKKGERGNWESLWQECADVALPRKDDIQIKRSPGEQKYVGMLDSTAMTSNELLAGALHGMLTNPAGYFFNLTTGVPELDQRDAVREYIQACVRKMHDVLNNSNFQTEVHEVYLDLGCFGTACLLMEEDKKNVVRFSARPLREVFIEENTKGFVDCLYRELQMDARGLVDEFGYDNLPEKIQKAYDKKETKKFNVLHAVYPKAYSEGKGSERFNFISQYVWTDEKVDLQVKGFYEFPFLTPRWSKASGESYGRGPTEKALPSAKSLQVMRATTIKGAQKVVDPPLQAPDDGFILQIDTTPAGITYYRAGSQDRIEPIFNDSRIDFGFQVIEQERVQVREAYYTDQLKLREGPQMTATEVAERVEQAMRFLGPMLGRQQAEFLQPMIERLYFILDRAGELPPVPAELQNVPLNVQYSSIMAMQQRMSEVQNIQRTMQNVAPFASSQPDVLDNFDGDAAVKYIAKLFNFPQELIRKEDALKMIRDQRAAQQQALAQAAQGAQDADNTSKIMNATSKMMPKAAAG